MKPPSMLTDSRFKQKSDNEQQLYDYLLELVQSNDPGQALEEIRDLFLTGRGSRNPQIFRTLETVIKGKYGTKILITSLTAVVISSSTTGNYPPNPNATFRSL